MFVLRQHKEKCSEQNKGLYATFDKVSRTGLWLILERLGSSPAPKFLQMGQLHENQRGHIRRNGELSDPFPIADDVNRAPTFFSILFSMMLKQATEDLDDEDTRYRLDGSLLNLQRLQAHIKTQERLIQDLLLVDDAGPLTHTEQAH